MGPGTYWRSLSPKVPVSAASHSWEAQADKSNIAMSISAFMPGMMAQENG